VAKPKVTGMRTNSQHLPLGNAAAKGPRVFEPDPGPNTTGTNNVDVDMEMASLAENHLLYNIGSHLLGGTFRGIRKSIVGQPGRG